jgi:hypothetical protein
MFMGKRGLMSESTENGQAFLKEVNEPFQVPAKSEELSPQPRKQPAKRMTRACFFITYR